MTLAFSIWLALAAFLKTWRVLAVPTSDFPVLFQPALFNNAADTIIYS
jgi:hypothetical protein